MIGMMGDSGDDDGRSALDRAARPVRVHRITILAAALALGISIGWNQAQPHVWQWLGAAMVLLLGAMLAWLWQSRLVMILLVGAVTALGAGWVTLQHDFAARNDLVAGLGEEATLLRVSGTALGPPLQRSRTSGSLARFDYREPATYFPMRVEALLARDGTPTPINGEVLVRIDEPVAPFRAGDHVETVGYLTRPSEPHNPGEFDYREYAKSLGQAGFLSVAGRDLLQVTPAQRNALMDSFLNWRDEARRRAGAWLLSDLPQTQHAERNSLLGNLLLGLRDEQIDGVYGSFQRVGLAHILAISGFHLSVLAVFVLMIARAIGGFQRWHGWLVIAIVLLYLMLVELRMPVLRSGVMTIAASLGLVSGRRLRASGLVSLSAILLLFWRPDQLFDAGFQLTYGVVLALIHLVPAVRRRWFGDPDPTVTTTAEMLGQYMWSTIAASVVAWLAATPIAAYHFGMVAPLGVPMSIIAVPLSAVLLAIGFLKMALAAILPSAAMLLGIPLSVGSDVLLAIVQVIDKLPFSATHVPFPSTTWSLLAVIWVCWWAIGPGDFRSWLGRLQWTVLAVLIAWLVGPIISPHRVPLRIDMLAVGDGSCYIVRSNDKTIVFDAGSSSDLNVGRRSLIPAMRRLGVRSIDVIAVTHADLDHYSAVVELAEEFNVGEVLVTPQYMAEAKNDPFGSVAWMIEGLTQRRVVVRTVGAGESRQFGDSQWTWLHPALDGKYEKANDSSMVIRIDCHGRHVLLCGDIQREAMEILLRDPESIHADVMELPHHGSHHDAAETFVDRVNAGIIMQSTGWTRWQQDKWAAKLAGKQRLVTIRDGACWLEIDGQGNISTGKFLGNDEN